MHYSVRSGRALDPEQETMMNWGSTGVVEMRCTAAGEVRTEVMFCIEISTGRFENVFISFVHYNIVE